MLSRLKLIHIINHTWVNCNQFIDNTSIMKSNIFQFGKCFSQINIQFLSSTSNLFLQKYNNWINITITSI